MHNTMYSNRCGRERLREQNYILNKTKRQKHNSEEFELISIFFIKSIKPTKNLYMHYIL